MRRLAIAIVIAMTGTTVAEPIDTTEAGKIFLQARDLAKLGQFDEACELFAKSYGLDPALGTAVNLADCLERQGHLHRAWALFDVVARNSQSLQSRARLARQRADALLAKLATVIIKLHDPDAAGLSVHLGDREMMPADEIHDLLEPGDIELVATVPGRPAWKTTLHAAAGATVIAEIPELVAVPDKVAVPAKAATRRRRSRVYLAGGLGAAGALGLGGSLVLAISAKHTYDGAFDHDCTHTTGGIVCMDMGHGKATIDRAGRRADLATGFAIGGVLLAAVAAAVFYTAPDETLPALIDPGPQRGKAQNAPAGKVPLAGAVQLAPIATSHGLGLGVAGRF